MHFPTLPRRWRLTSSSSSEASKPPKYGRKQPQQSRKTAAAPPQQSKLFRSASFTGDPMFKVPQVPKRQQQKVGLHETAAAGRQPCPHCPSSGYEPSWRSRSLVNLQPAAAAPQQNHEAAVSTASIFSNNLRSNSWRNLSLIASESSIHTPNFF